MKKSSLYTAVILFFVVGIPLVTLAQGTLGQTTNLVTMSGRIVNTAIGILSALALLVFIWGIVKYIASAGDADKAKEGKSIMIYGVLALFVLFSVFGLVQFLQREFNLNSQGGTFIPPQVSQPTGGVR